MSDQKKGSQIAGVIGFFDDTTDLIEGAEVVRDGRYPKWDAFTPFPVHGLDAAMGIKRSFLPYVTFAGGLAGVCLGFTLEYWTSAMDWALNVGGKPFNSWPAFVPVMFELTILFAGLSTVAAMFAANKLPNVTAKAFDPRLTKDRMALFIEGPKSEEDEEEEAAAAKRRGKSYRKFDESEAASLLRKAGAKDVKVVYREGWF